MKAKRPGIATEHRRAGAAPGDVVVDATSRGSAGAHPGRVAAILFVALFAVYASNLRVRSSGDNIPARLLPFSILREGNLDLDEFDRLHSREPLPYYVAHRQGHFRPATTVALPLVIAPLYVVPAWVLSAMEIPYDDVRAEVLMVVMERISAATLAALGASLLFLLLLQLTNWRWALGISLIYALGTTTWSISSQGLFPHGVMQLALVLLSSIFLTPGASRSTMLLAGFIVGIAIANRPQFAGFAILTVLYVWRYHRGGLIAFVAPAVILLAAVAFYNIHLFEQLAGSYRGFDHFSTPLLDGLAGLLFSPNRGLFVFTPIAAFAFWGALRVWRTDAPIWFRFLSVGLLYHLVLYAKFDEWWAGHTYGPRYMTDVLPVLCLMLVYGLVPLCRARAVRFAAAVLILYGVAVQAVGVYWDDNDWNRRPVSVDTNPLRVWDWSDWQVMRAVRSGWHGGQLWPLLTTVFREPVPARLYGLSRTDLATEFRLLEAPARLEPGGRGTAVVVLTNRSEVSWPAFAGDLRVHHVVFLLSRWFANKQALSGVGDVLRLPRNLPPGLPMRLLIDLTAPTVPGSYEVDLRVTQAFDGTHGIISRDAIRFRVSVE